MEKRMNYCCYFMVCLALVGGWQPSNGMVVSPRSDVAGSPRSARSDSQRDDELVSPVVPKTPNNSPRDDLKDVKKASDQTSTASVESNVFINALSAKLVATAREKLQRGLAIMKNGVLMVPELTDRDEERYPLHWAVRRNDPERLALLLATKEYDVNKQDAWGATPLYWAALGIGAGRGGPDRDRLGRELASDDGKDQENDNKAATASVQNNITCFDLLLRAGANPNICTKALTLDYRLLHQTVEDGDGAESGGVRKVGGDSVAHVLFALSNIEGVWLTTWWGYVVRLINHRADFKIKNHAGQTPLDLAPRVLRTRLEQNVEKEQAAFEREAEAQAGFEREKDAEIGRFQKAYQEKCAVLSGVWEMLHSQQEQQEHTATYAKLEQDFDLTLKT